MVLVIFLCMGLLNAFFATTMSDANKAKCDEDVVLTSLNEYKLTLAEKEQIIGRLEYVFGERKKQISKLQELLNLELVDIKDSGDKGSDLISDIQFLEHDKKIKRVEQLERSLAYGETKYKYVYELSRQLYATLKMEAMLLKKLSAVLDLRAYRKLIVQLKSEFVVENAVLEKIAGIDEISSFHKLLLDLVKGEHVLQTLGVKEKRIIAALKKGSPVGSITDKLVKRLFDAIYDSTEEAVAAGVIDNHFYARFEFINRPEFVDLVRRVIKELRAKESSRSVFAKDISEQVINAFVHLFREQYNAKQE